jgi:hypothetical protein
MSNRVLLSVALLGLLLGCGDEGPEVPILFISPPAGSNGAGRVTSSPTGIDCTISNQTSTGVCSANFEAGTIVTLSANSSAGSAFTAWGEACTGAIATCEVTLDDSKDVTAQFTLANPRTLTVAGGSGSGSGTIISSPGGLNCAFNGDNVSGTCSADFADGAVVTLSALPVVGSGFTTWGGDCAAAAGAGTCNLTMSAARNATAQFVSVSFSGLLASASDDQSGLIVVSIPTASASIGRTKGTGVSLSAAGRAEVIATGTIRFLNGEPRAIAGTYDTENQVLEVTSATGFDMTASFSGEAFDGVYFDAVTQTGGPTMLVAAPGTTPPAAYCGTFAGQDAGTWNVVIADPRVSASRSNPNGNARSMVGDLSGRTITLVAYTGAPPDSIGTGSATGTLSSDGTSIAGTWSDFSGATGTWQATTTACQ